MNNINRNMQGPSAEQTRYEFAPEPETQTRGRGLAAADPQTRARVASAGGLAVSQDRKHMSEIGRLGGKHSHVKQHAEATTSQTPQSSV